MGVRIRYGVVRVDFQFKVQPRLMLTWELEHFHK
jgi:hypothetical protein